MTRTKAEQEARAAKTGAPPKHAGGPPRICPTPEIMQERVDAYFEQPGNHTICGLALALGFCTRVSFLNYADTAPQFSNTIARAKARVEAEYEDFLRHERISAHGSIFALKSLGWKDEHDVNIKGQITLNDAAIALHVAGAGADAQRDGA